ncbi:hypothetical protein ACFWVP_17210 [Streptomyces sp. NPDC058637]|uniref:hypothetical protein n=1 Tax=Streptomyces sp. NPDC058637 TaxID=3346569 RepID=UPI003662BDB3
MTQSGQGDEQLPAVRPTHEGVVLPAEGGAPWTAGGRAADQAAPAGGQPWGQAWGPAAHEDGHAPGQLPPEQPRSDAYGYPPQQSYAPPQQSYGAPQAPYQQQGQQQPYAQPLPPEAVPGMAAGGDADATQYIAPVPGGMPPERPAESTQYLGQSAPPAQAADADATQYIPPVPGGVPYGIRPGTPGERQPPAEFDNLFRNEAPAGATQQMPQVGPAHQQPQQAPQHQQPSHQPPYQQHQGAHGQQAPQGPRPFQSGPQAVQSPQDEHGGGGAPRRRSAHIPLIAAVVVGCAVIGLGAGALLSGGEEKPGDDKQPVSAQSSPTSEATGQAADPAETQAQGLDKLLADSNDSRAAVISAVARIENCQALDQAATDLRGAATQRRDLVTRLEGLSIDQLPSSAELKTALTAAWQASAEADDHYAAWAGQAKNDKKVCKGGKARSTGEKAKANASSGVATREKQKASGLWNSIAEKWALTKRAPTEL